jgi:hypothetical protein
MDKKVWVAAIGVASLIPVFRSGGREGLNFWEWIWNHTIWGPNVEYIPEEDYAKIVGRFVR